MTRAASQFWGTVTNFGLQQALGSDVYFAVPVVNAAGATLVVNGTASAEFHGLVNAGTWNVISCSSNMTSYGEVRRFPSSSRSVAALVA